MRRCHLCCVLAGFLLGSLVACRPTTLEQFPTATVASPTQVFNPTSEAENTISTAIPPEAPTPLPTVTPISAPLVLPNEWQEIGRPAVGLALNAPANWIDVGSQANISSLAQKFGQSEILFLATTLTTGTQILTGRELTDGAFAISFRGLGEVPAVLNTENNLDPVDGMRAILGRLGRLNTPINRLPLADYPGAFVDLTDDPTGLILANSNQVRLRFALFINPETRIPIYLFLGAPAQQWDQFEAIFGYMAETIMMFDSATVPSGVRHLDVTVATGGRDAAVGQLQADEVDYWTFEATGGRFVTVVLKPEGANTDFTMTLRSPSGETVVQQDNGYGGDTEVIADLALTESGTYTIEIREFFGAADSYTLSVILSDDVIYRGGGEIQINQQIASTLQPQTKDDWYFDGQAGQLVSVILTPAGEFDALFTLYSPDGQEIATFDEGYSGDVEILASYRLPVTGRYRIEVSSFAENGGRYTLALDEGSQDITNFYEAGDLMYGATQQEELREKEVHAWYITGRAGDEITLTTTPLVDTMDLEVWLLDPDAQRLVMQDDALTGGSEIINYTLPRDGQYIVVVQEFFGYAGSYSISLKARNDNYTAVGGNLTYGQTVKAALQTGRGTLWLFEGREGDIIEVVATPDSAERDFVLSLRDPQGNPVLQVDDVSSGGEEALRYQLTAAGEWSIVVQEQFDKGGIYTLSLTKE